MLRSPPRGQSLRSKAWDQREGIPTSALGRANAPRIGDANVTPTIVAGEKRRARVDAGNGIADIGLGGGDRAAQRRGRRIGRFAAPNEGVVAGGDGRAHITSTLLTNAVTAKVQRRRHACASKELAANHLSGYDECASPCAWRAVAKSGIVDA